MRLRLDTPAFLWLITGDDRPGIGAAAAIRHPPSTILITKSWTMPTPPANPKIYHIAHVDRLPSIIADGGLCSDAVMIQRTGSGTTIWFCWLGGMTDIKRRRLTLPVRCHSNTYVGDYVPFYFCSRSIMLYVIHCANHPELAYRDGQEPIIHLEADLVAVVAWANNHRRRWAFSLSNASAIYTQFRCDLTKLDDVNWPAVAATDFRSGDIKEGKQAEFLMHGSFPWELVDRIGVRSQAVSREVANALQAAAHRPAVEIRPDWYYLREVSA